MAARVDRRFFQPLFIDTNFLEADFRFEMGVQIRSLEVTDAVTPATSSAPSPVISPPVAFSSISAADIFGFQPWGQTSPVEQVTRTDASRVEVDDISQMIGKIEMK